MVGGDSYDQKYTNEAYYWGKRPQAICARVVDILRPSPSFQPSLIDLGCGEGRNAVYFASQGFRVVGLDLSVPGLAKMRRLAGELGVHVDTIHADLVLHELQGTFDVVFSTGTLHYLPPEVRGQRFQHYKDSTSPGGINALSVFVTKPFLNGAPDCEQHGFPYRSGELMSYYWDWEILYCTERIFDCTSGGIPHRHAVNRIIAKRCRKGA